VAAPHRDVGIVAPATGSRGGKGRGAQSLPSGAAEAATGYRVRNMVFQNGATGWIVSLQNPSTCTDARAGSKYEHGNIMDDLRTVVEYGAHSHFLLHKVYH
jgi:hypothetical protein